MNSAVMGAYHPEDIEEIKEAVMDAVRWLMRWAARRRDETEFRLVDNVVAP